MLLYFIKPKFNEFLIFLLILTFLIVFVFYFNQKMFHKYTLFLFNSGSVSFEQNSLMQYLVFWKTSYKYFLDNIIFGMGPTNFQHFFEENNIPNHVNEHPHNHYLQAFTETGIFGGLSYILLIVFVVLKTSVLRVHCESKLKTFFIIFPISIVLSLFWPFANGFDLYGQQQNCFLWFMVTVALAFKKKVDQKKFEK